MHKLRARIYAFMYLEATELGIIRTVLLQCHIPIKQ